jgi:hypothetical protein
VDGHTEVHDGTVNALGDGMRRTQWFSVRHLLAVGLVGLAVGWGAFLLTGQAAQPLMAPGCRSVVEAGFDPITGLPHGATIECGQLTGLGGQVPVAQVIPMGEDLAMRRAFPILGGVAVGGALALGVLAIRKVRTPRSRAAER